MQIIAGGLIVSVLYMRTPDTYLSTREETYLKVFSLVNRLSEVTEEEGGPIIDNFIRETGIDLVLYDADESTATKKVFVESTAKLVLKTPEEVRLRTEEKGTSQESGSFTFWYKSPEKYWASDVKARYELEYFYTESKSNVMPLSIRRSLPLMVLVIAGVSLICSIIYTLLFAKPVMKISEVSRSMAKMDFSQKCKTSRGDEIGDLARDLNTMADALDEKMKSLETKNDELQSEVTRRKELESQKDMFFSAASHELKTPVTVLEGQIRGMIEGVGPYSDHDEYLPKTLGTVKRMESLINEILMASRMQSGQEIKTSRIDMVQLLEDKMEEFEELYSPRGIKMELSFENDLIFEGNREFTSLAIGAFLSNAAFYSQEGATVTVDAKKENEQILVTVRNTDAHIDEEDLPHLFEPFYRTDKSRSRRSGGSGLGLYLAKLILEKQNGTCRMQNDGNDVLATIEIPAVKEEK